MNNSPTESGDDEEIPPNPPDVVHEGGVNWSQIAPHSDSCTCSWCEEVSET